MARPKKVQKVKEPIRIRERKLANGNISLYLDIYQKGARKVESLGLYIVPEATPLDKAQNKQTRQIAEKIKSDRILALRNYSVKQWDKVKRTSMSLVDYLKQYENEQFGVTTSTLKGRRDMRIKVEAYLNEIGSPNLAMATVDVDVIKGFISFLSTVQHGVKKEKAGISIGCAEHHQSCLNSALNKAVRDGIIKANPFKSISSKEKFQKPETMREYLTLEELQRAMPVPCFRDDVKKAFMFSCFTGLRLSDVRSLTWSEISLGTDGKTKFVRTRMQKTQSLINLPLSQEALSCLRETETPNEPIFNLPSVSNIELNLSKWLQDAGITKHITFHCARHTFATMMLTLGADIYTTSKLLGHANVNTTQIYAKIVDQKKVETINLMDNFFGSQRQQ